MIQIFLISGIVIFAILALLFRDLLTAAISLSITSALLALHFYQLGANLAAIFELSVGAGLVTIMFVCAISLVESAREEKVEKEKDWRKFITLVNLFIVIAIFTFAANIILSHQPVLQPTADINDLGNFIWGARGLDMLGQAIILFCSILGIILLFRTEEGK